MIGYLRIAHAGNHGGIVHALGAVIGVAKILVEISGGVVVTARGIVDSLLLWGYWGHGASRSPWISHASSGIHSLNMSLVSRSIRSSLWGLLGHHGLLDTLIWGQGLVVLPIGNTILVFLPHTQEMECRIGTNIFIVVDNRSSNLT